MATASTLTKSWHHADVHRTSTMMAPHMLVAVLIWIMLAATLIWATMFVQNNMFDLRMQLYDGLCNTVGLNPHLTT